MTPLVATEIQLSASPEAIPNLSFLHFFFFLFTFKARLPSQDRYAVASDPADFH
jgi:hypothetical protein